MKTPKANGDRKRNARYEKKKRYYIVLLTDQSIEKHKVRVISRITVLQLQEQMIKTNYNKVYIMIRHKTLVLLVKQPQTNVVFKN